MDAGAFAEDRVELGRIHRRDPARVEVAEPPLELERSGESRLHRHLLVEAEADQERERISGEERVGLVVAREVDARGRCGSHG